MTDDEVQNLLRAAEETSAKVEGALTQQAEALVVKKQNMREELFRLLALIEGGCLQTLITISEILKPDPPRITTRVWLADPDKGTYTIGLLEVSKHTLLASREVEVQEEPYPDPAALPDAK